MGELDHPLSQKIEVITNYLTKLQYSNKQASISCFVNHGPQMFTTPVLMSLFEPLGQDCDNRYLKPTILAILGDLMLNIDVRAPFFEKKLGFLL